MPPEKNKPQTPVEQAKQAGIAATKEVLDKSTVDALMNATPESLIKASQEPEVIKGNARPAGLWLHGPAQLQLFAAADRRMTQAAKLDGMQMTKVERVHLRLVPGTQLMVIKAASSQDATATTVNRFSGSSAAWINAIDLLGEAGLTLETGYRQRYDLHYIPEGSPLWPGLVFDLSKPLERRTESTRTKKSASANKTASAKQSESASAQKTEEAAKRETTPDAGASEAK